MPLPTGFFAAIRPVCRLKKPLSETCLQKIAAENRLSETAFLLEEGGRYLPTWFTPEMEIDLCGHATRTTAYVVFSELNPDSDTVGFDTTSGIPTVIRKNRLYRMDFPSPPVPCPVPGGLEDVPG